MRLEKVFHSLKTSPFFIDLGIPTFVSVCIPPARRLCELNDQTPPSAPTHFPYCFYFLHLSRIHPQLSSLRD